MNMEYTALDLIHKHNIIVININIGYNVEKNSNKRVTGIVCATNDLSPCVLHWIIVQKRIE